MIAVVAQKLDPHQRLYEEVREVRDWLLQMAGGDFFAELHPVLAAQMRIRAFDLDVRLNALANAADGD